PTDDPDFYPSLLADEVIYDDDGPWPLVADGTGVSLHRGSIGAWGDDATSWIAAATTPGAASFDTVVLGRHVFYNGSVFDGNATDKLPLLPGEVATKANYTSYGRGLNGVMIDLANLPTGVTPTAGDFLFHVGNDDTPGDWPMAPGPSSITFYAGGGTGGSDRVTIVWPDGAIRNTWLQVTVLGTNLGLTDNDVFYYGNAIAESGNSPTDARVTTADLLLARNNPRDFLGPAGVTFPYDFDRDGQVNAVDVLLARNNQTNFLDGLKLIDLSGEGEGEASIEELAWLTALDQPATGRPAQKDAAAEAVDLLLSLTWPSLSR
ncbi:MAG: hypothetical protein HQ567_29820, partial [Candidatus Nealsonbacteria bacterium]|nr:hypothetical protein [Candidatus Nealsonbacteria bacterium]